MPFEKRGGWAETPALRVGLCHIGLGPLGRQVVTDFVRRGLGTVTAVVDVDPRLADRPVDEVVSGAGPTPITSSIDDLDPAAKIDVAIVTTRSDLESCADTFRSLLSRGIDTISSCEELLYPAPESLELARDLDRHATENDARLIGTGINPGFLMDALPVAISGIAHRVDRVRVSRTQNASTRRIPFQAKIGATLGLEEFEARVASGTLRHVGLGESLHFLSDHLGIEFDRWVEKLEPIIAESNLECGLGPIPSGHARGVLQTAHAFNGDDLVIDLEFRAAIDEPDPCDRVQLWGEPELDVSFRGGVPGDVSTSAILLNTIPALLEAPPGLHTMGTLRPPRVW